MKKNILMVYPEFPLTYWGMEHALKFVDKKAPMPPLGLLTIAAMFPPDYNIRLIDLNVTTITDKDVAAADLVFLSAMIVQKESFHNMVELCNRLGRPVVAGGPYATSCHYLIEGVDHFILGEGELLVPEFINDFEHGTPKKVYSTNEKPDITRSPVPRYDLADVNLYGTLLLQFSRGCPFSCEFCDIAELFGRVPRLKTPEQFLRELDCVARTGYRGPIFLVDDNFIGHRRQVVKLLRKVWEWQAANDFPFSFFTSTSIDLAADDEILDLMVESGFYMVFLGLETPDVNTLGSINKAQNIKHDMYDSIKKIQSRGLEVTAGLIIGFDTDTDDIFDRQISFIQEAAIPMAMIGLMVALPGTRLIKRLEEEGRMLYESGGNNTTMFALNYIPVMDTDKIISGYKKVLETIYSPVFYFERSLKLLSRKPRTAYKRGKLRKGEIKAFLKSLAVQSFSGYGYYYIRFLVKAFFINRKNFPLAVNLAIKGHHFFKFTREILCYDAEESSYINYTGSGTTEEKETAEFAVEGAELPDSIS